MDLIKFLEELKTKNYYEVLGVELEDSNLAIRKARTKLLAKYHPDLFSKEDNSTAVSIASLINIAFEALTDAEFRNKYNESGFNLIYSVGGNHIEVKTKAKNLSEEKKQAPTITGTTTVENETLINGGTAIVNLTKYPDVELPETIEVIIPKNTKSGSVLIFKGNHESITGNIIVLVTRKGKLSDDLSSRLIHTHEKFIHIDSNEEGRIKTLSGDFSLELKNEFPIPNNTLLIINDIGVKGTSLMIEGN